MSADRRSQAAGQSAVPEGEEWRSMDGGDELYSPARSEAVLRAAKEGIERHRKGDVTLRVVDASGRPLKGLPVEIEQQRHAFTFAEQLWPLDAMVRDGEQDSERARAWKHRFLEVFNGATNLCYWTERPRNDASKTEDRQGEPRVENFARTVDWCCANDLTAKGHPLFWAIDKCTPDWVKRYDVETEMKFAEVRVRNLVARFRGRVTVWDVVNEALWEPAPKNRSKRHWPHMETMDNIVEYIAPVMRWCREEDPDATYLINDYGVENETEGKGYPAGSDGSTVTAASQRARYVELLARLRDAGHPPDAVGLQSHTGWVRSHAEQTEVYDAYSEAGWPVHITEFWAHLNTLRERFPQIPESELEAILAEYVANYLTTAFGHPAVGAFSFWGFMGMAIEWRERSGHELKPVFHRVRDLIHKDWQTSVEAVTDESGAVSFRGFYGDYALRHVTTQDGRKLCFGKRFALTKGVAGPITIEVSHYHGGTA